MPSFFPENEVFENVESLYAPPGATDPGLDSDTTGSSNHANVFNNRLQKLVSRTAWLKKFFTSGRLSELLSFTNTENKLLGFDSGGELALLDFPLSLGTVRFSVIAASSNPFQDDLGFWWFVPNGDALNPSQEKYEKLYKAVWASMDTTQIVGGKGTSADSDWNAGKNINYPDCRDDYLSMHSATRLINSVYGSREVTLIPENYRHGHNMSLQGFTANSISNQQSAGATIYNAVPFAIQPAGNVRQNVAGNRVAANDGLGAIWENTPNAAAPININPPGISLEMMIYLGYRY
jgi:hypothetical protein